VRSPVQPCVSRFVSAASFGFCLVPGWPSISVFTRCWAFFFVAQSLGVPPAGVRTATALLFLTFTLANVLGAIVGAKPVDRFDKRAVVFMANGVVAIGLLALMLTAKLTWALLFAGLAGIAWGVYFIADWALACTLLPRNTMASAMAVWNIAATLPQIVAPLITTPIVERVNAFAPGTGPRVAIGLAIVEFTIGALWLYRLPTADAKSLLSVQEASGSVLDTGP
jgi:MFS family permease